MTSNYTDLIKAMHQAMENGKSVKKVILSEESMEVFMTDEKLTKHDEEMADDVGEFEIRIESGPEDKLITEDGDELDL